MIKLILITCLIVLANSTQEFSGKNWVVLVVGSDSITDYRHPADVYHAYQIVRANGIPDENIIVMHYDDVGNSKYNKYPGKVFNDPNMTDVYHDVPKDYTGKEVTPENFLKVLSGDKELAKAGKKVLNSGPDDHVFVFFDDHGDNEAEPLVNTLKEMHANNKFAKLVFYIEACYAGSMFENLLPNNISVYATTASNSRESSWACYWDNPILDPLADEYSVRWMEHAELSINDSTLQSQYEFIRDHTPKSHVMQYGDLSIAKLPMSQFLGQRTPYTPIISEPGVKCKYSFPNNDVPLFATKMKMEHATNEIEKEMYRQELSQIMAGRQYLDNHLSAYIKGIGHLINTESP
ncbi:unnamed protein product, partial [Oppiella nova]